MSNDYPSPARIIGWASFAVALLACIAIGGHYFGWWLAADSTNRAAQVNAQSYGAQQSHRDELAQDITQVRTLTAQITTAPQPQADALRAQRWAMVGQACAAAAQITEVPLDQGDEQFVTANCAGSAGSPTSQYAA